jgi:hypothetical protein
VDAPADPARGTASAAPGPADAAGARPRRAAPLQLSALQPLAFAFRDAYELLLSHTSLRLLRVYSVLREAGFIVRVPSAAAPTPADAAAAGGLGFSMDVFMASLQFSRSAPGPPLFRVVVVDVVDAPPTHEQLAALLRTSAAANVGAAAAARDRLERAAARQAKKNKERAVESHTTVQWSNAVLASDAAVLAMTERRAAGAPPPPAVGLAVGVGSLCCQIRFAVVASSVSVSFFNAAEVEVGYARQVPPAP